MKKTVKMFKDGKWVKKLIHSHKWEPGVFSGPDYRGQSREYQAYACECGEYKFIKL